MKTHPIAIIGAGPAGIAAAIQLKRYGIQPLLFERDTVGGLLRNAGLVENYPGFPKGVEGMRLARLLHKHLCELGINILREEVSTVDYHTGIFTLLTDRREASFEYLIIASGTRPKQFTGFPLLDLPHVCYEVYPLRNVRGKRIAIVGAGDAAFDYALNLASRGNCIRINNRGTHLSCLPLLWERVGNNPGITYRKNCIVKSVEQMDNRLRLTLKKYDAEFCETVDYLLFAIGRKPNLGFLSRPLEENLPKPEKEGRIYLIGDVKNGLYRQAGISIGDGIRVAMAMGRKLCGLER